MTNQARTANKPSRATVARLLDDIETALHVARRNLLADDGLTSLGREMLKSVSNRSRYLERLTRGGVA